MKNHTAYRIIILVMFLLLLLGAVTMAQGIKAHADRPIINDYIRRIEFFA